MPPKSNRLTTREFNSLPRGKFLNFNHFDLRLGDYPTLKLACVVKSKLFKSGVERNKARRLAYNFLYSALKGKTGFYIIYPKKTFLFADKHKLKEQFVKTTN